MFSFIRQTFQSWARSGTRAGAQRPAVRHLQCEGLEERAVPSLTGSELLVNGGTTGKQHQAAVASSSAQRTVIVWTEVKLDGESDIKGQIYDGYGNKVGREFLVAGGREVQHSPDVAMDSRGNFAVIWTEDFTSADKDIKGARFDSSGRRLGDFRVAWSYKSEYDASIVMASNGNFTVAYTYLFSRSDADVQVAMFYANGTLRRRIEVANGSRNETEPAIGGSPDGRFAVAYVSSGNVYLSRYTSGGTRVNSHTIASTSANEVSPDVAMDNGGNSVVTWQSSVSSSSNNVLARRVSSTGSLGRTINVQTTSANETAPAVAVEGHTGRTVISYVSSFSTLPSVKVSELTSSGFVTRTSSFNSGLSRPAISVAWGSRFFVAAQSEVFKSLDRDGGIFARLGTL